MLFLKCETGSKLLKDCNSLFYNFNQDFDELSTYHDIFNNVLLSKKKFKFLKKPVSFNKKALHLKSLISTTVAKISCNRDYSTRKKKIYIYIYIYIDM